MNYKKINKLKNKQEYQKKLIFIKIKKRKKINDVTYQH